MIRFDNLPLEVQQSMCTPLHQILPPSPPSSHSHHPSHPTGALYLGSLTACLDTSLLHTHHITHLVQVLDAPWLPPTPGFKCYRIEIMDIASADLGVHLEGVCKWIEGALKRGENVLVHCQQGVSRSPAIIIAYLIRNLSMSFNTAYDLVKHKRPCINPNSGFVKVLHEWDLKWNSTRPGFRRGTSLGGGAGGGEGRPGLVRSSTGMPVYGHGHAASQSQYGGQGTSAGYGASQYSHGSERGYMAPPPRPVPTLTLRHPRARAQ